MKRLKAARVTTFLLIYQFSSAIVFACPVCRVAVDKAIDTDFWQNFVVLSLPLLLLAIIGVGLFYKSELQTRLERKLKWHKTDFR